MEKNIEKILLFDVYGKLLTNKQQDIFKEYYLYNLSLREIAENKKISYQGVRDSIKTSENLLESFEKNVGMLKLLKSTNKACEIIENSNISNEVKDNLLKLLKSEDDI